MINVINQYHPVTNDIEVLKKQREDVWKFSLGWGLTSSHVQVK